ncbi:6399_t:CDS:2, partial [Rhizophagus irregularis]
CCYFAVTSPLQKVYTTKLSYLGIMSLESLSQSSISSTSSDTPILGVPLQSTTNKTLKTVLSDSWINLLYLLFVFIPLGYLAHGLKWNGTWIFILNFLAIIPSTRLIVFVIKDICLRADQSVGGLLNATFGNAVEIIVSIIALKEGKITVVQAFILGSIISNLLLVLGLSFVAGGILHKKQEFNKTAAQTSSSLMTLACIGLIIPAAFISFADKIKTSSNDKRHEEELINLSHEGVIEDDEQPQLTLIVSLLLLVVVTVAIIFSAEYLVDSIEGIGKNSGLNKIFVSLILLPIATNATVHTVTATTLKNEMNLAINYAVGNSMQIALFVSPLLVILGWIIGQQMTLFFKTFETIALFISVLITNYLIQDGESNWLEGTMLLATYIIYS